MKHLGDRFQLEPKHIEVIEREEKEKAVRIHHNKQWAEAPQHVVVIHDPRPLQRLHLPDGLEGWLKS